MTDEFRSAGPTTYESISLWTVASLLLRNVPDNGNLRILGDSITYLAWLRSVFGPFRLNRTRESIWLFMASLMREGTWTVYEFGVAWGYTTHYWLSRDIPSIVCWLGFDRFTGLPTAWRNLEKGEFSADGKVPDIRDPRLQWHVGDVEQTLPDVETPATKKCIFFDLDVYLPTVFACNHLRSRLAVGDLIYFDELFDADEQRILNENLLPHFELELLGCTGLAAAFRIVAAKTA
jgi:hypothetical protein